MTKRILGVAALLAAPLFASSAVAANWGDGPEIKKQAEGEASTSEADTGKTTDSPAKVEEPKAEPKRICRRIRLDPSSRRASKVCMTSEEWRKFNQGR